MAPLTERCIACLKNFTSTDLSVQLSCFDSSNSLTVQGKLKACVPELVCCSGQDELCTTCNYMLGICYKFRVTCLKSQEDMGRSAGAVAKTGARPPQANNSKPSSTPPVLRSEVSLREVKVRQITTTQPPPLVMSPARTSATKRNDAVQPPNPRRNDPPVLVRQANIPSYFLSDAQDKKGDSKDKMTTSKCYVRTENGFVPVVEPKVTRRTPTPTAPAKQPVPPKQQPAPPKQQPPPPKQQPAAKPDTSFNITLEDLLSNVPASNMTPIVNINGDGNIATNGTQADDKIASIENDTTLPTEEKNRRLVEEILKCNSHLQTYSSEMFECRVQLEPLPKFYVPKSKDDDKTGYLCQCNHCGLTFTSKVKLLSHIRRHFNYKPHQCSICERRYYEADDLKMHMMAHKVNAQKQSEQGPPVLEPEVLPERAAKVKFNMNLLKEVPPAKQPRVAPPRPGPKSSKPVEARKQPEPVTSRPEIPIINIKTESIFEELNTAPPVPLPQPAKKPAAKQPVTPAAKKPPPKKKPPNPEQDHLEKYVANLRCRFCNLLFQTDAETTEHLKQHCRICFELCESPRNHMKFHNVILNKNKKKIYLCLICGNYNPRGHFITHNKVHDIECDICHTVFNNNKQYLHHKRSCPVYTCQYCQDTFATLNIGRTHEYHAHEKQYKLNNVCPMCKAQFTSPKLLKQHQCEKCHLCDEFVDVKQRANHICAEQAAVDETMQDPLADPLEPLLEPMMEQPMDGLELEDSKASLVPIVQMNVGSDLYCDICNKTFDTKRIFDNHECYNQKGERFYRCEICTGSFNRLEFVEHMKMHIS